MDLGDLEKMGNIGGTRNAQTDRQTDTQRISPMHWDPIGSNNLITELWWIVLAWFDSN